MTKLIVDEALRAKLNNFAEHIELCDESGKTLGYFLPAAAPDPSVCAGARSPITDDELERRRREPGGRTLAEIWARLRRS